MKYLTDNNRICIFNRDSTCWNMIKQSRDKHQKNLWRSSSVHFPLTWWALILNTVGKYARNISFFHLGLRYFPALNVVHAAPDLSACSAKW